MDESVGVDPSKPLTRWAEARRPTATETTRRTSPSSPIARSALRADGGAKRSDPDPDVSLSLSPDALRLAAGPVDARVARPGRTAEEEGASARSNRIAAAYRAVLTAPTGTRIRIIA